VLGVSLWPFAHQLLVWLSQWEVIEFDARTLAAAKQLIGKIQEVPPALLITTLGIVPAVCEEFFFRGYLLSSLRNSMSATRAILLSSILFGLFHLVATDRLHFERLVPSTALGLALGWLCVRCGSALPGMLLHAVHNSLLLAAAHYQQQLADWGWGLEQTDDIQSAGLPTSWLVAATIGTAIGFALVWFGTRNLVTTTSSQSEAPSGLSASDGTLAGPQLSQTAQLSHRPGEPPA
jgi:ABC-2 type transport system permease protein/sodium transport system permease protein